MIFLALEPTCCSLPSHHQLCVRRPTLAIGNEGPQWSALTISAAVWHDWHNNFFFCLCKIHTNGCFSSLFASLTRATHYKLSYTWKAPYVRRLRKLLRRTLGLSLIFSLCAFCLLLYARANCVSSGIWHVLIQTCDGKHTHTLYIGSRPNPPLSRRSLLHTVIVFEDGFLLP